MKKLVLASSSPRRQQILRDLGLDFVLASPVHFEELLVGLGPKELVCHNALGKAREAAKEYKDAIIIGCDTVIVFGDEVLGKPLTPEKAKSILTRLSGNYHSVVSGLGVINTKTHREFVGYEETKVKFRNLAEKEIDDYIESGEPLDKAGAYGIQERGGAFVEEIEGSFSSVVGLPKELLIKFLSELGIEV